MRCEQCSDPSSACREEEPAPPSFRPQTTHKSHAAAMSSASTVKKRTFLFSPLGEVIIFNIQINSAHASFLHLYIFILFHSVIFELYTVCIAQ